MRLVAARAPHLHHALRSFVLGAFAFLVREVDDGEPLPFAFEEHVQRDGPALYEYCLLYTSDAADEL